MSMRVYNLSAIEKMRQRLYDDIILNFVHEIISGPVLLELTQTIMLNIPGVWNTDVVRASLIDVCGQQLDKRKAQDIAWRLAGNVQQLKLNRSVPPYLKQTGNEWVPCEIINVEQATRYFAKTDKEKLVPGAWITFRILAGSPSGKTITKFWSDKLGAFLSPSFGFAKWKNRPEKWPEHKPYLAYRSSKQYFGLRVNLLVTPELCVDGKLGFEKIRVSKTMQDYNREILTKRSKFNFKCPKNYSHECYSCPIGKDSCIAACHARTYIKRHCPECKSEAAWFDPQAKSDLCLKCRRRFNGATKWV